MYVLSSLQHTPSGAGLGWIWALANTPLPRVAVPGRLLQSRCVPCPLSLVACQTKPNPAPPPPEVWGQTCLLSFLTSSHAPVKLDL